MRIGVVMALWRREAIARLALRRVARASAPGDVLVAVTDEPGNAATARELGWEVVAAPNSPLSDKHGAGALALRGRVDALVVVGSDNWVCDRFFDTWRTELQVRPVVGVLDSWQVCIHRPEALYYPGYTRPTRIGESMGVGRGLRADVLDRLNWCPWPRGLERGLDGGMRRSLTALGYDARGRPQADYGVRIIGIKSPEGLTPAEKFLRAQGSVLVPRARALEPFPDDERVDLDALCTY